MAILSSLFGLEAAIPAVERLKNSKEEHTATNGFTGWICLIQCMPARLRMDRITPIERLPE